ncbi:MAG TPA: glycosyltransferase family 87 protein [Magnetospirillum sp.]|jgi:hypothetical protein|nr:glycosyltransferase family 87 protein [Magnetospirillum sp.]
MLSKLARWCTPERLAGYSGLVLFGYVLLLAVCYRQGIWFVGSDGPHATDFVNVWAAGRLALSGNPAAIYDWAVHRQAELAAVGHDFEGYFGWHYPPMLLMAAVPLSTLPYVAAWLGWSVATLCFLAWALWQVMPSRAVVLPLLAAPTTLWCVVTGQNGFLTAALVGGTLAFLHRRPLVAGAFLALLTYKPQFGLLFPVALVAGGHWRVVAAATLGTLAWAGLSAALFGVETWQAFLGSAGHTLDGVLRNGAPGWSKLQSVYAVLHQWLGSEPVAWGGQAAFTLGLAGLVAWAFRRPLPYGVQAAILAAAVPLATPYAYVYDLPVLAVAGAFLAREGVKRGFLPGERMGLAAAMLIPAAFPLLGSVTALIAAGVLIGLAVRRALAPAQ